MYHTVFLLARLKFCWRVLNFYFAGAVLRESNGKRKNLMKNNEITKLDPKELK
jgi:hypothetical protein